MMIELVLSIAFPACFIVVLIGCLNCLQRKKKAETFRARDATDGRHDTAFSVDVCDIPSSSDQVVIEPLPDILSKVSTVQPQRPQITCAERSKQETTLSAHTVQRSFPRDHLTYLNEIGSGWFGKAIESEAIQSKNLKIVDGSLKSHVVVKMLKDDATKVEQKQFLDEVNAFRFLEHANIMSLLGQCTETAPYLVILEFAAYSSLKNYLVQNKHDMEEIIASNRLISFALDAASGLACLQRHDCIHNDLAARNCLVMSDYTLKIGDYGISDHMFKNEYYNTGSELLPIRWMAPEILAKVNGVWTARSHKSSDMWSFGVLLWEIASLGERPYDNLTDDAVLQEVVLDRRVLPSELDIKTPFKDKMWSIMVQCWQNPSDRLDVEQAFSSLEQLNRIRVDTISDFDQKWNQLEQNQVKVSSFGIDLGSRIALAGSFLMDDSSSSPDQHSGLDEDGGSQEGTKNDDVIINIGGEGIYNLRSHDQSAPTNTFTSTDIDHNVNVQQHENSKSILQDQVRIENETTNTPLSPSHLTSLRSSEQSVVKTSTPVFKGQSSTSNFYSPNTSQSSEYLTPNETLIASRSQEISVKDFSNIDKDISLNVEGDAFHETLHDLLQKPVKPSNNLSNFNFSSQAEDEDFSDFVRTSPTAPAVDFTDFASADNHLSTKAEPVTDKVEHATLLAKSVEPAVYVAAEDNNSFSEFTEAVGVKDNLEDDMTTFSDFVTSLPSNKANNSIIVVAEVNAAASSGIKTDLAESNAGKDIFPSFESVLLDSDISLISSSEAYTQNGKKSEPSHDIYSQQAVAGLKLENEINSADISPEKVSTVKVVPDQNQNIFSSENMPSDIASLNSDASFLSGDLHVGTSSNVSVSQSQQSESFTFVESSRESLTTHIPTTTDDFAKSSNDIDIFDKNSSTFQSVDPLDEKLHSDSAEVIDSVAFKNEVKTQSDHEKESNNSEEKSNRAFESVFDNPNNAGSKQETIPDSVAEVNNFGEQITAVEHANVENVKF